MLALRRARRQARASPLPAPLAAGAPSFDSMVSRLVLAQPEHALGYLAEVRRFLEAARTAIAICPSAETSRLRERAEAEIKFQCTAATSIFDWIDDIAEI